MGLKKKKVFLKLVGTCLIHRCTFDRPHRCFVGLGEGAAPTALFAFHQLIVKQTAVAEVRDRLKATACKTKRGTRKVVRSSHPRLNKPIGFCFIVERGVFVAFGGSHAICSPCQMYSTRWERGIVLSFALRTKSCYLWPVLFADIKR